MQIIRRPGRSGEGDREKKESYRKLENNEKWGLIDAQRQTAQRETFYFPAFIESLLKKQEKLRSRNCPGRPLKVPDIAADIV